MTVIDIGSWKGMLLDAQSKPYTKEELKNWEEHYGGKLSVFKSSTPSMRYVLGYEGRFKQTKPKKFHRVKYGRGLIEYA